MKELVDDLLEVATAISQEVEGLQEEPIEQEEDTELSESEYEEVVDALKKNTTEFTTLKLIEELAELQEKLIKFHLKSASHKPKMNEILDEIGDVGLRVTLFLDHHTTDDFDPGEYVDERVEKKIKKLHGYYKEGKYKGGL